MRGYTMKRAFHNPQKSEAEESNENPKKELTIKEHFFTARSSPKKLNELEQETNELLGLISHMKPASRAEAPKPYNKDEYNRTIMNLKSKLETIKGDIEHKLEVEKYIDHKIGPGKEEPSGLNDTDSYGLDTLDIQDPRENFKESRIGDPIIVVNSPKDFGPKEKHRDRNVGLVSKSPGTASKTIEELRSELNARLSDRPLPADSGTFTESQTWNVDISKLKQRVLEAQLEEDTWRKKYYKEVNNNKLLQEEHENQIEELKAEISKLSETIHKISLSKAEITRKKNSWLENKRISELEAENKYLLQSLEEQKRIQASEHRAVQSLKVLLKEKEYEIGHYQARGATPSQSVCSQLLSELQTIKSAQHSLQLEYSSQLKKLESEVHCQLDSIISNFSALCDEKDAIIRSLQLEKQDLIQERDKIMEDQLYK